MRPTPSAVRLSVSPFGPRFSSPPDPDSPCTAEGFLYLGLLAGGAVTIKRPPFYFDPHTNSEERTLHYSMPPLLKRAFGDARKVIFHLQKANEARERACRARRSADGRRGRVLGAEYVRTRHPWAEPRSPRQFSEEPTPSFMTRLSGKEKVFAKQTTEFRMSNREELHKRIAGEAHEFPYGTYRMRVLHGAPVAEAPPADELSVCAPGIVDAYGDPWTAAQKQTATRDAMVCAVDVTDVEETLAERILEGETDAVDRRAGPGKAKARRDPASDGGDEGDGEGQRDTPNKRVVLRGASAASRRRRKKIQRERRAREAREKSPSATGNTDDHDDLPDPSPPPE